MDISTKLTDKPGTRALLLSEMHGKILHLLGKVSVPDLTLSIKAVYSVCTEEVTRLSKT